MWTRKNSVFGHFSHSEKPRLRHGQKYKYVSQYNDIYIYQARPKQHLKAQFMKLSNTEAELKKSSIAYK